MKINDHQLSPEQREQFLREGYFIAENVFDPADLEPLRSELEEAIDRVIRGLEAEGVLYETHADKGFDERLSWIYRENPDAAAIVCRHLEGKRGGGYDGRGMFDLITHPKLLRAVGSIVGEEIVASSVYRIRTKIPDLPKGEVPWHQDSGYFLEHCDDSLILTCWVPLIDATVENGCMYILPRSHHGGILRHFTGGHAGFLVIREEDLPDGLPEPVAAKCPRGGVVFMTNLTAHCSRKNYTDQVRWSVDLRYQNAGTPNNLGLWPTENDAEELNVACYPPEADFVVQSRKNPAQVATFEMYRERRRAFEEATIPGTMNQRWSALAPT